jgi:protein-disulfide isomerase
MFCIISFIVLSILGLFSATNRKLAKEALDCVSRRVTLRPCNTGFDEKMKAKILGSVITRSEFAARLLNKYFEVLAWVFFVLLLASSAFAIRGIYLYYVTGSCNGANSDAFCVFDPKGQNNQVSTLTPGCQINKANSAKDLTLQGVDLTGFPVLNAGAKDKIVFVGCYDCDFTRKAYPMIMDLVKRFKVEFTFLHYPVKEKTDYSSRLGYCVYQQDPEKFWKLNDILFATDKSNIENESFIQKTLTDLGMDLEKINICVNIPQTEQTVQQQMEEILKTRFYGTPTIFINNGVPMVGPKPYRVYAIELKGLFYWLR